jgi:hypothetical protein
MIRYARRKEKGKRGERGDPTVMMDDNADEDANLCFVDLRDDHDGCLEIRRDGTFFFRLLRVRQRDRETLRTSGV